MLLSPLLCSVLVPHFIIGFISIIKYSSSFISIFPSYCLYPTLYCNSTASLCPTTTITALNAPQPLSIVTLLSFPPHRFALSIMSYSQSLLSVVKSTHLISHVTLMHIFSTTAPFASISSTTVSTDHSTCKTASISTSLSITLSITHPNSVPINIPHNHSHTSSILPLSISIYPDSHYSPISIHHFYPNLSSYPFYPSPNSLDPFNLLPKISPFLNFHLRAYLLT